MAARAAGLAVSIVTAVALAAGGWAWADAADLVPGPLTARPPAAPPDEPAPEPVLTAPAELQDVVGPPAGPDDLGAGQGPAEADPVDATTLATVLAPLMADPALGPSPTLSVRDLVTGEEVVRASSTDAVEPASTAKLVTAAAALHVLGPERRLPTRVAWLDGGGRPGGRPALVLVGGGDLLLGDGEGRPGSTDGRVGLLDLARSAVDAATEGGVDDRLLSGGPGTVVDVVVDDSLLGAPQQLGRGPVDALFAAAPASLAVAAGRLGEGRGRDGAPATTAGAAFARAVDQAMAEVLAAEAPRTGSVRVSTSPVATDVVLAEGLSAPLVDVLAYLLVTSDNTVADSVAGLVAAERGEPTALASASRVVVDVVSDDLGVDLGPTRLTDGSGLSDGSLSSAAALSGLLAASAAAPADEPLGLLSSLLPVAGLEGTLSDRFGAADGSAGGRGVVRAKTGTLTGTVGLAGIGTSRSGRGLSFALLSDGVPADGTDAARVAADRVAATVATCC